MQHQGIPTRLLDWTLSPLVALYFAVKDKEKVEKDTDACVWVFNPWTHNKNEISMNLNILKLGYALLSSDKKETVYDILQFIMGEFRMPKEKTFYEQLQFPIGFIPIYQNDRLVHQSSVFTIHGTNEAPLEKQQVQNNNEIYKNKYLKQIIIPQKHKDTILYELHMLFINEYTIFPDFEGMRKQFREMGSLYKLPNIQ